MDNNHNLQVGDIVRMNIDVIGQSDLDGVEITNSGKNYWQYMLENPNETYKIIDTDVGRYNGEDCTCYVLDGYMNGEIWYADELIKVNTLSIADMIRQSNDDDLPKLLKKALSPYLNRVSDQLISEMLFNTANSLNENKERFK